MIQFPTIIAANVEWHHRYANDPELILLVDEAWDFPNPFSTWEHRVLETTPGGTLYLATKDVWAHFVCVPQPQRTGDRPGVGAYKGQLLLDNGEWLKVTDGWSSRAGVMNLFLPPKDHIMDVIITARDDNGLGRHGLAVRKDAMGEFLPDSVHLVRDKGEPCYIPSLDPLEVVKK